MTISEWPASSSLRRARISLARRPSSSCAQARSSSAANAGASIDTMLPRAEATATDPAVVPGHQGSHDMGVSYTTTPSTNSG